MQTQVFSRNMITVMMLGVRHDYNYLKVGCKHLARPLSETANANSKLSWNGRYYLKIGCECKARLLSHTTEMQTRDFSRNMINVMMIGLQHNCYYHNLGCKHRARPLSPTANANSKLSSNLITVMLRGIRNGC